MLWQLRKRLVDAGFARQLDGEKYELLSPLEGHTAVAVFYSLTVHGIKEDHIDIELVKADCACAAACLTAPPAPHRHATQRARPALPARSFRCPISPPFAISHPQFPLPDLAPRRRVSPLRCCNLIPTLLIPDRRQ